MIPNFMTQQAAKAQQQQLDMLINDPFFARQESFKLLHARLGECLRPDSGGKVLELGCGPGKYIPILVALGYEVTAVDPIEYPSWAKLRLLSKATLKSQVYAEKLPFSDASFDHVVCLGTLLYVDSPDEALSEILRVLKPGGSLVLRTVNLNNLYTLRTGKRLDPASKHLFSMSELLNLLQRHGFVISRHFSFGFMPPFFTNFWWYLISVWLPAGIQHKLSELLPAERRHNNVIFASKGH